MNQVQELEQAILARAERLAAEYRDRAQRSRDNILRAASDRLRLREEREEAITKALGERTFRQQVQANELKLQSDLDRVRWNLVTDVERRLGQRMDAFRRDEPGYLDLLSAYLAQAAGEIESDDLVAEVNRQDLSRLRHGWEEIAARAAPGKSLQLSAEPIETVGGVLVRSADNRIRVDNTFEGRLERLSQRVRQVILERLLPMGLESGNLLGG
ncbi:MAG: V-type ATP synthase subunit E family protein [Chromatiaceae bacterium]|jgi:V/A-type H+-transporting ATPase subunit E